MFSFLRPVIFFLFIAAFFSNVLYAGTVGTLEGIVRDKDNVIVGATVLLIGTSIGRASDVDGRFLIYNIPAGKYSVRIQMIGYKTMVLGNVQIHADIKTRLDIVLTPSAVELEENVIVVDRPLLQRDILGTIHVVRGDDMKLLPVTTFQEVLSYKPGTTVEGNVRGGKATEVLYLIDGLPAQNFMAGGSGADLPMDAITEIAMQTGGFDAEYGNAQSGIVNVVTKSGSNEFDGQVNMTRDNWFGRTEVSREANVEASSSGPIVRDRVFYFLSLSYDQSGTRWWQDFQHFFAMPIEKNRSGLAKVDYVMNPSMRLSTQFLFSSKDWRDYQYSWRYNLAGLPASTRRTYRAAAIFTHTLSDNTFYSARVSYYRGDSRIGPSSGAMLDPTRIYEYDFYLQYILHGDELLWSQTSQKIVTAKGDLTSSFLPGHLFKSGGEINFYFLESDIEKYEPKKTFFGKPLPLEDPFNFTSHYSFHPTSGMAYIQDKFTIDRATISLGLRYDFMNPSANRPAFESVPVSQDQYEIQATKYVPASIKYQFSPRFGLSIPITESGYIFFNYGYYFQFPLFDYLYSGIDIVKAQRGASALLGNPNLEPERTQAWEVSVKEMIFDNVVGSALYFRKESENLIDTKTYVPSDSKAAGDFGFVEYVNNPYADVSGIELSVSRAGGSWWTGDISYSYMTAEGVSGSANQGLDYLQWGFTPATVPFYLSWDQRHTVKANVTVTLPFDITVNAFYHYHSARPYTYYPSRDGFTALDSTIDFLPNNKRMGVYQNLDLKAMKSIPLGLGRTSRLTFFVDARNLLNAQNVKWMDASGRIGGELADPSAYYSNRRVRVGARFEIGF